MNKFEFIGTAGGDAEISNGRARFRLCTDEKWTDKDGQEQKRSDWHSITAFGKVTDAAAEAVKKGAFLYVVGSIRESEYVDKEGNKRYGTDLVASKIEVKATKKSSENADAPAEQSAA